VSRTVENCRELSRFTNIIERKGLIEKDGTTAGLAGLVAFSFESEPANLIVNRLLRTGTLHSYLKQCKKQEKKEDRRTWVSTKLCQVLAQFYVPKRAPTNLQSLDLSKRAWKSRRTRLPSENCPYLPALPHAIRQEVDRFVPSVFFL